MIPQNFYPLAKIKKIGENAFYAISAHAFFKKKDAIAHLKEIGWSEDIKDIYELVSVDMPTPTP